MHSNKELKRIKKFAEPMLSYILEDRPYKLPSGYRGWSKIALELALTMSMRDMILSAGDWVVKSNYHRCGLWLAQNAPLYVVDTKLVEQFENTEVATEGESCLLRGLTFPLDTIMFIFQKGLISSPEGTDIDWITVHIEEKGKKSASEGTYRGLKFYSAGIKEPHFQRVINWSSSNSTGET